MLYRENGQFKTRYGADQQIFPILQDRWLALALIAFAFIGVPMLASEYMFRAILIPFVILSLAALGLNLLVGYTQVSNGVTNGILFNNAGILSSLATTGTGNDYRYFDIPSVTSISPTSGPLTGGTVITINGLNLDGATKVTIGTTEVTTFASLTDTTLVFASPARAAGEAHITVTTPGGTSTATSADLFTAWRENLILERFFEPVLDRPSDGAPAGVRWSPDQRALAATQMQFDPAFYLSHAAPPPIAEWPSWCLWLSVGAIVVAILTAC